MKGVPRLAVETTGAHDCGEARPFGPVMMKLTHHDFLVNDANHLMTGVRTDAIGQIITVMLARDPGLMPHGMGLVYQVDVDAARSIAADLVKMADQVEAAAADQAKAAIDAARGKAA